MTSLNLIKRSIAAGAFAAFLAGVAPTAAAEVYEIAGAPGPAVVEAREAAVAPVRAFRLLSGADVHRLGALSPDEDALLRGTGGLESRSERTRVGIMRALPSPVMLVGSSSAAREASALRSDGGRLDALDDGRMVWTAGFSSEGAGGLRLHLEAVRLPAGAVAFVYGRGGEMHGPYLPGGELTTNTVFDDEIFLEIQLPAGAVGDEPIHVAVTGVGHLAHEWFAPSATVHAKSAAPETLPACFRDLNCVPKNAVPEIESISKAVAQISFRDGSSYFVCSGALMNTTAGNKTPYLLTAGHCVSKPEVAATVEAFWDYRTTSCGASAAQRSGLARTLGASLLVTGSKQSGKADFSLLRLSQDPPAGRYYLGWSAAKESVAAGTVLHRVAHPDGGAQSYSSHVVSTAPSPGACPDLPVSRFIYSKTVEGATKGGSSGSPLVLRDGLKVVGQHFGRCGRNLDDACDSVENSSVDGSFAAYFGDVRQWLAPAPVNSCSPSAVSLCLTGGRFRVEVLARDLRTGRGTTGTAISQNDIFGYFSLPELTGQSENPEIFVKIVDGTALNGKHWVFYGGLTDLEFTLKVTDVTSGLTKTYLKSAGSHCGDSDTSAF